MLGFLTPYADVGLMLVSLEFIASLAPTVWSQFKSKTCSVPLMSSVGTTLGLVVIVLFEVSLGLHFAAAAGLASAVLWSIVAAQRVLYGGGKVAR
ncbi:hypothetical protein LCGC14_2657640 [marine sediment metagenome]|uniref:Polysaccharide biosynthesis protein C-terminal domain-containing protein n=1 Tax=marine sediment metagenome TaxID=412755 RepID=A0A0F9C3B3_9ZZZZ